VAGKWGRIRAERGGRGGAGLDVLDEAEAAVPPREEAA